MSIADAARALGLHGRNATQRLRRHLLALERRSGSTFLIRAGGAKLVRYVVTLALLRHHAPHLFDRRDHATETLREYVADLDARLAELHHRDETIATAVATIRADLLRLTRVVDRVESALTRAASRQDQGTEGGRTRDPPSPRPSSSAPRLLLDSPFSRISKRPAQTGDP